MNRVNKCRIKTRGGREVGYLDVKAVMSAPNSTKPSKSSLLPESAI